MDKTIGTEINSDAYRAGLTTVNEEGKRIWIFAKMFKGKWQTRRRILGYSLLAFLFIAPWLKMNGHQMLQFDFVQRKFVFFGSVFWPHDFYLFVIAFISFIIFIFLFTAIFGRLFCGWACPQTIFMEMVFRRIEYFIEGDANAQRKLAKQQWNTEKILKKGTKHFIFFGISFIIANVFLSYIIGSEELLKIANESPAKHWPGLISITIFSFTFYGVFAYMREQVCTIVCPYGRLQSVLLDDRSLTVAYDYTRGENRQKWIRNRAETAGDCIDCRQCVEVCPTGIDIRNGIQLECVNCTACIDACNNVMTAINKPINLIGFASLEGIEKKQKFKLNSRSYLYSAALVILVGGFITLLALRSDIQATILRTPGMTFIETPEGKIKNIYNIKVLNKTFEEMPVELKLESVEGTISTIGKSMIAPGEGYGEGIISIEINKTNLHNGNVPLRIGIYANGKRLQTVKTTFMAPNI